MKKIWEEFIKSLKDSFNLFYDGIKIICKSTFAMLKETCMNFVKGVFNWLAELLTGLTMTLIAFAKAISSSLASLVKAIYDLLLNKILDWIKKW